MGIYQGLYALIEQYIYGGNMTTDAELVTTLLATAGCIFLITLPFMMVLKIIKIMMGV